MDVGSVVIHGVETRVPKSVDESGLGARPAEKGCSPCFHEAHPVRFGQYGLRALPGEGHRPAKLGTGTNTQKIQTNATFDTENPIKFKSFRPGDVKSTHRIVGLR